MSRQHYRVVISYNGSNYFGWQDLGAGSEKPTIQSELLRVLRKISRHSHCVVAGASRTDAGVHALGQVARLTTELQIDPDTLRLGLNSLLPADIRIRECRRCEGAFNPNRHCLSKTYRYFFCVDETANPLLHDVVAHVPMGAVSSADDTRPAAVSASDDLQSALERMRGACRLFLGEHDFAGFAAQKESSKSTRRTIFELQLHRSLSSDFGSDSYYFEIRGSGFLRHMLRYICGALFEVGRGHIDAAAIGKALAQPSPTRLTARAKSCGLHLTRIDY